MLNRTGLILSISSFIVLKKAPLLIHIVDMGAYPNALENSFVLKLALVLVSPKFAWFNIPISRMRAATSSL
jgi:hypothetical protein